MTQSKLDWTKNSNIQIHSKQINELHQITLYLKSEAILELIEYIKFLTMKTNVEFQIHLPKIEIDDFIIYFKSTIRQNRYLLARPELNQRIAMVQLNVGTLPNLINKLIDFNTGINSEFQFSSIGSNHYLSNMSLNLIRI